MDDWDFHTIAQEMWSTIRELDYFQNDEVGQHLAKAVEALLRSPTTAQTPQSRSSSATRAPDATLPTRDRALRTVQATPPAAAAAPEFSSAELQELAVIEDEESAIAPDVPLKPESRPSSATRAPDATLPTRDRALRMVQATPPAAAPAPEFSSAELQELAVIEDEESAIAPTVPTQTEAAIAPETPTFPDALDAEAESLEAAAGFFAMEDDKEIAPAVPTKTEEQPAPNRKFAPSIGAAAAWFQDEAPASSDTLDAEAESLEAAAGFFATEEDDAIAPETLTNRDSTPSIETAAQLFQDEAPASSDTLDAEAESLEAAAGFFATEDDKEIAPAIPTKTEQLAPNRKFAPSIGAAAAWFQDEAPASSDTLDAEAESLEAAAGFFATEEDDAIAPETLTNRDSTPSIETAAQLLQEETPTFPDALDTEAESLEAAAGFFATEEEDAIAPAVPTKTEAAIAPETLTNRDSTPSIETAAQLLQEETPTFSDALDTEAESLEAAAGFFATEDDDAIAPETLTNRDSTPSIETAAQLLQEETPTFSDTLDTEAESLEAAAGFFATEDDDAIAPAASSEPESTPLDTSSVPEPPAPPDAEVDSDLIHVIFEAGVEVRLKDFAALLARQPTSAVVQTYWQKQVDVFLRMADSLNLPGFRAVVEAGETAIAAHPDQTMTIAPLLLENLRAAQAQVLAGDHTVGGSVSPELTYWLTPTLADASEPLNEPLDELDSTPDVTPVPEQVVLASDLAPAEAERSEEEPQPSAASLELSELVTAASSASPGLPQSIRIDLAQLAQLNHVVGEIRVHQNQRVLRNRQVRDVVQQLDQGLQQHRRTLQQLQQIETSAAASDLLTDAIAQTQHLNEATTDLDILVRTTHSNFEWEQQLAKKLQDLMDSTRVVSLASMLKRFPPMVKQLALTHQKPVELHLQGTEVCVDKTLIENLYNALLHLVLNAFEHGIESAERRREADKPEQGRITIAATHQGNHILIQVQDDGQGLDIVQICEQAVAQGLLRADQAQALQADPQPDARLLALLCTSGFSTATEVSKLSGRGVGLDVVKAQLAKIKGQLQVRSQPGQGCCFTIQIRESLLTTRLLICQAGRSIYGFVTHEIEQVLIPGTQLRWLAGQKVLDSNPVDETCTVPIYALASLLPVPAQLMQIVATPRSSSRSEIEPALAPPQGAKPVLLLRTPDGLIGLEVDQILTEQELEIKPISTPITPPSYVYGCTVLADGQLTLVLDGALLVQKYQQGTVHEKGYLSLGVTA